MDTSISNFELSASTVKVGSDSEKSSDRSENFEDILESDPDSFLSPGGPSDDKTVIEDFDDHLPPTVTLLRHPVTRAKVYLVGTAHFSRESQEDVIKVIRNVQPHVVILELCNARTSILSLDEATVLEEAKNINMDRIISTLRSNGVYNGIMYLLLLNMSAHLTKEIGMAPGGEFRVAYQEARKLPNCGVHLGDRPIQITLKRALARLSWFQTMKLAWHLLTSKDPISKEDIESCKRRDLLEQLLADMAGEYPALGEVFVSERDIYLTHSLQTAAAAKLEPQVYMSDAQPLRVVGIVGIGHVVGITRLWTENQTPYLPNILIIPPPTLASKLVKISFRVGLLCFGGFLVYRYVPVPRILKESCTNLVDKAVASIRKS